MGAYGLSRTSGLQRDTRQGMVGLGTTAQMIDFRVADPRANSRFASHRFPVFTDQLLVLQASNSLTISRLRARILALHRIAFPSFTDQLLVLQASDCLMISRARAWARTCKDGLARRSE
jgi:hypothetical protein